MIEMKLLVTVTVL